MASKRFFTLSILGCLAVSVVSPAFVYAADQEWSPGTAPTLDPQRIRVGGGEFIDNGNAIQIQKGETVQLSAVSVDQDILICKPDRSKDEISTDPNPAVNWSTTGGTLSAARTNSGASTTFTAPNATGSFTVTAVPDDNTQGGNGDPLNGHPGSREDGPNSTGGASIVIKVIDSCPTDASLGIGCSISNTTLFSVGYKTGGLLTKQTAVSGGTPPNPPNNWNDTYIKEHVSLNAGDTTAIDSDLLHPLTIAYFCTGGAEGFVVGKGRQTLSIGGENCVRSAEDNKFWDDHLTIQTKSILNVAGPKTIVCDQHYSCGGNNLNGNFTITRTLTRTIYGSPAYYVTTVGTTKN